MSALRGSTFRGSTVSALRGSTFRGSTVSALGVTHLGVPHSGILLYINSNDTQRVHTQAIARTMAPGY